VLERQQQGLAVRSSLLEEGEFFLPLVELRALGGQGGEEEGEVGFVEGAAVAEVGVTQVDVTVLVLTLGSSHYYLYRL
jgi:hypothetical protein